MDIKPLTFMNNEKSKNIDISVICVYNNNNILKHFLINSLRMQKEINIELIAINNNEYKNQISIAQHYNTYSKLAKGNILLFAHQDISFYNPYSLITALNIYNKEIEKYPKTIAGALGSVLKLNGLLKSNVSLASTGILQDFRNIGNSGNITDVETLDECLFITTRDNVIRDPIDDIPDVKFDHYATVYTYILKKLKKYRIITIPIKVNHVPSIKYISDIYKQTPIKFDSYAKIVVTRFNLFYKDSYYVKRYLDKRIGKGKYTLPSTSLRYPLPSVRLSAYIITLNILSLPYIRRITEKLVIRRAHKLIMKPIYKESIGNDGDIYEN